MRKLLFLPLVLLLHGCSDDSIDEKVASETKPEGSKHIVNSTNDGNIVAGLHYNLDSANRFAIIKCNEVKITQIGNHILDSIMKLNKKLEFRNEIQEAWGYFFTEQTWAGLKKYGYSQADVSYGGYDKHICLLGHAPYTERGLWEVINFRNDDMATAHPILFNEATDIFFRDEHPQITDVSVSNQGGAFIEYAIKVDFNTVDDQAIYYTVSNEQQKIVVTVDKFGMK